MSRRDRKLVCRDLTKVRACHTEYPSGQKAETSTTTLTAACVAGPGRTQRLPPWQVASRVRATPMGSERVCRCFVCDSLEVAPPGPEPQHFRRRWTRPCPGCARFAHRSCLERRLLALDVGVDTTVCITGLTTVHGSMIIYFLALAGVASLASESQVCVVPHPSNENWTLDGAELQYKLQRFFAQKGPPPLEEVFISTQNFTVEVQETIMKECPGLLISAFLVLAETQLPISPENSGDAVAKADSLAQSLDEASYAEQMQIWPIQAAFESYTRAMQEVQDAQRQTEHLEVQLVICHCRESLDWLAGPRFYMPKTGAALDVFIYEKCNFDTDLSKMSGHFRSVSRVLVDDKGMRRDECSGYLQHLIDHYEEPADYTLFFQADAADHLHWGYLSLVMKSLELHTLTSPFVHLNYPRLITSLSPCRAEVFRQIFDRPPSRTLGSYCCAQFAVSRARIKGNPLERYQRMQQMLFSESPEVCHDIPGHPTLCLMFEVYWHVLFGEKDELPTRAENAALQLFLRIRDLENESCLARPPPEMKELLVEGPQGHGYLNDSRVLQPSVHVLHSWYVVHRC
ncbi:unnamed protein product [Cladocopium goreaui]|uniref:Uncharacterized protein n=1 Tax=Cladocopium goreaui TaxID=2562237 RepID=A0A9P1FWC9_9DINO|nr:unnamed protein product [Cladocopium goreaui]